MSNAPAPATIRFQTAAPGGAAHPAGALRGVAAALLCLPLLVSCAGTATRTAQREPAASNAAKPGHAEAPPGTATAAGGPVLRRMAALVGLPLLVSCAGTAARAPQGDADAGSATTPAGAPPPVASPATPAEPAITSPSPAGVVAPTIPAGADARAPAIVDRLLPWTAEREALTHTYLRAHRTGAVPEDPAVATRMEPRVIVLHWTAGPTAESAWQTFAPARLAGRTDLADGGALNVGAHYLVDRDGTIYRLAPEERVLRHCIGLNHVAIGVENVGGGDKWPLTDAQVEANAALVRWVASRRPITHLVGHLEYRRMEGHPHFEERDPNYRTAKPDPGAPFMAAVRARVADLRLAGAE